MKLPSILLIGFFAVSLQAAEVVSLQPPVPDLEDEFIGSDAAEAAGDLDHQPHDDPNSDTGPVGNGPVGNGPVGNGPVGNGLVETESFVRTEPFDAGGCPSCGPVGCGHYGIGHAHAWRSRCNMPQHMPYFAQPSTYYYLRPYNHFHLPLIQEEARFHGAAPTNPYDTDLFERVYSEYEDEAETIPMP